MEVSPTAIRGVDAELQRLQMENERLRKAAEKAYAWLREDTPVDVNDLKDFDWKHSQVIEALRTALAAATEQEAP